MPSSHVVAHHAPQWRRAVRIVAVLAGAVPALVGASVAAAAPAAPPPITVLTSEPGPGSAITVKLDERDRVATLVASDNQPEGLAAASQGNAQTPGGGGLFVGWGSLPYFSQFDRDGQLIYNAQFPTGVNSYRAYLLPWENRSGGDERPAS